jgi:hypothetical protein
LALFDPIERLDLALTMAESRPAATVMKEDRVKNDARCRILPKETFDTEDGKSAGSSP